MSDDHELSGLYALDALEPDERVRFEQHLLGCESCLAEIDQFRETMAMIASSETTPEHELPAGLRANVLRAIGQTAPTGNVRPIATARRARRPLLTAPRILVAAAALAIAAIGVGSLVRDTDDAPEDAVALLDDLRASGAATIPMNAPTSSPAVSASLVRSQSSPRAVLVLDSLSPVGADQTYQAWTIDADQVIRPTTVFRPDGDRTVVAIDVAPRTASVAITVEPKGGSRQPTTPVVLFAALS